MKRRLFKLALFLLLGAVTTIATSWYFAAGRTKVGDWFEHAEQGSSRIGRIGAGTWHVHRNERLGQVLIRRYRSRYSPEDQPPEWDIYKNPAERFVPIWALDLLKLNAVAHFSCLCTTEFAFRYVCPWRKLRTAYCTKTCSYSSWREFLLA